MPVIGFQISPEQLAELDRVAGSVGNTRSGVLRLALRLALDQMQSGSPEGLRPEGTTEAIVVTESAAKPVTEPGRPEREIKSYFKKTL